MWGMLNLAGKGICPDPVPQPQQPHSAQATRARASATHNCATQRPSLRAAAWMQTTYLWDIRCACAHQAHIRCVCAHPAHIRCVCAQAPSLLTPSTRSEGPQSNRTTCAGATLALRLAAGATRPRRPPAAGGWPPLSTARRCLYVLTYTAVLVLPAGSHSSTPCPSRPGPTWGLKPDDAVGARAGRTSRPAGRPRTPDGFSCAAPAAAPAAAEWLLARRAACWAARCVAMQRCLPGAPVCLALPPPYHLGALARRNPQWCPWAWTLASRLACCRPIL